MVYNTHEVKENERKIIKMTLKDAEVLEYKVKGGMPVKTSVGYYPYKDSYVMVKARKL